MGVTHHQQIAISGTTQLSGPLIVTGAGKSSTFGTLRAGIFSASAAGKQSTMTKLNVTGTLRSSGIFSASAAGKQSTMTKLDVTGTMRSSGIFSASAAGKQSAMTKLDVTGTMRSSGIFSASAAGKQSTMTKLNVTGTMRSSGIFSASAAGKQSTVTKLDVTGTLQASGRTVLVTPAIASAANAAAGKRVIATAATTAFSIATTKVLSSSRIFLTPHSAAAAHPAKEAIPKVNTIASGVSFSIRYTHGVTPTGATGVVNWLIVNV